MGLLATVSNGDRPGAVVRLDAEVLGEAEVRRRLDRAIGRALVDRSFAAHLLADPTLALGQEGCTPQQRRELRSISAASIKELAEAVDALFWPRRFGPQHESSPLALAAGM